MTDWKMQKTWVRHVSGHLLRVVHVSRRRYRWEVIKTNYNNGDMVERGEADCLEAAQRDASKAVHAVLFPA